MDIRLHFDSFWDSFDVNDNIWIWILRQKHNVIIDSLNPNLVFTTDINAKYPNAIKVYYSNEPYYPEQLTINTNLVDFSMSNFFIDLNTHIRFPSYYMYIYEFIRTNLIEGFSFFEKENRDIPIKTDFCCFVSRTLMGKRGNFFNKLNKYKKIHTNVAPHNDFSIPFDNSSFSSSKPKIEFIKKYKFNIAFENDFRGNHLCFPGANVVDGFLTDMSGLISEKLVEPFVSGTIPIYWGSKIVSQEFNSKTFLSYYDFKNENDLIDKIIELDKNDNLYNSYFKEKILNNHMLNISYIMNLFDDITNKIK